MKKGQVLVVEDHPEIAELVRRALERERFDVQTVENGRHALEWLKHQQPDLILLDWMLPELDGLFVVRYVRRQLQSDVPLMMLTAKNSESDIVDALNAGADDYVTKPFGPAELVARVQSLLRRSRKTGDIVNLKAVQTEGDLSLDPNTMVATLESHDLRLTLTEFRILYELLKSSPRVLTRDQLIESAKGGDIYIVDRNVDVHIASLRRKIGHYKTFIKSVRGIGYKYERGVS